MLAQALRFGGVGGLATSVHVLSALVSSKVLQLSAQQANLTGFATAVLVSYFAHARFTFRSESSSVEQFLRFVVVAFAGLAVSSLTVALCTEKFGLSLVAAMMAVAVLVPASSFLAMRFWVFTRNNSATGLPFGDMVISASMALGVVGLFWGRPVHHDVAWYLIATREWEGGSALYTSLMEVNPPLNFYFTLPALWIADVTGISDTNAQYVTLGLLFFVSLFWAARVLRHAVVDTARLALILLLVCLSILLPGLSTIAQRDQILVLFLLPWALNEAFVPNAPRNRAVPAALFAALGICLKPHFVIFPLAVSLLNCMERRTFRPLFATANWVFLLAGLAYIAFVRLVHPAYFTEMVGIALQVYGAYAKPGLEVLSAIAKAMGLVAFAVVLSVRTYGTDRAFRVFLALAAAGLGTYFLQGTGFTYHKVPFLSFGALACALSFRQLPRVGAQQTISGAVTAGLLVLASAPHFYRSMPAEEIMDAARGLDAVNGVMTLSSNVYAGPPVAFRLGTFWASRYPAQWLVPGAVNQLAVADCKSVPAHCETLFRILDRNRSDIIADIVRTTPDLLVVDKASSHFDRPGFDWLGFLAVDPHWPGILAGYHRVAETPRFLLYRRL